MYTAAADALHRARSQACLAGGTPSSPEQRLCSRSMVSFASEQIFLGRQAELLY